jgi:hypothetical protein
MLFLRSKKSTQPSFGLIGIWHSLFGILNYYLIQIWSIFKRKFEKYFENIFQTMSDFSEKNQWSLIDKYFQTEMTTKMSQFLRENNYDYGKETKYYTIILEKFNKVKTYSKEERTYIISEGKKTGINLLLKKNSHLLDKKNTFEVSSVVEQKKKPKSFLEILASMNKVQKECFFEIMKDVSETNLPKLIKLIEFADL